LCSARWIGNHGFSIGIDDIEPADSLNKQKNSKINEGYEKCDELITSYSKGELTLQPGCNAAETLEVQVTNVLNKIRESAGDVRDAILHYLILYYLDIWCACICSLFK
jgi:DNA-directed RNA polymerase III subunit RPC1